MSKIILKFHETLQFRIIHIMIAFYSNNFNTNQTFSFLTSRRTLIPNAKHLTKHHRVTISRLPGYVMALHATCHDNTDFHGINLISLLADNMRQIRKDVLNDHYQQAQGILAMCSTGHRVRWQYVEDLLNRQRPDGCFHKPCSSVCTNERIGNSIFYPSSSP